MSYRIYGYIQTGDQTAETVPYNLESVHRLAGGGVCAYVPRYEIGDGWSK